MSKLYFQVDWGCFCDPLKEAMLQARFAEDEGALENINVWGVLRLWSLCVGRLLPCNKGNSTHSNSLSPIFNALQPISKLLTPILLSGHESHFPWSYACWQYSGDSRISITVMWFAWGSNYIHLKAFQVSLLIHQHISQWYTTKGNGEFLTNISFWEHELESVLGVIDLLMSLHMPTNLSMHSRGDKSFNVRNTKEPFFKGPITSKAWKEIEINNTWNVNMRFIIFNMISFINKSDFLKGMVFYIMALTKTHWNKRSDNNFPF